MTFTVEKGVPLPALRAGRPPKYPWRGMSVGDSFFVPGYSREMHNNLIRSAAQALGSGRVATRKLTENDEVGVRVWRLK